MTTDNLNEQLTEVWEIKHLCVEIRHLVTNIEKNQNDIIDRPHSEANEYRKHLIQKQLQEIEEKKALIKEYAAHL